MNKMPDTDVLDDEFPYDPDNEQEVMEFWKNPLIHTGIDELREKLGRLATSQEDPSK